MEQKAKKILIVDTDEENLRLTNEVLCPPGYRVIMAQKAEEALTEIHLHPFDIILLDADTSKANGYKILRLFKEDKKTNSIPIIIMTGNRRSEDSLAALAAGADEVLAKPIDRAELQIRVKSLLKVKAYNDYILNQEQDLEKEVARRTRELTKALEKIKVASLDTVYRLSRAAEYKDEDTGAHVQRMSHYSSAVARKLGLDEQYIENILFAAPMHDVGKIGIPDRVLLKPGKLDDDEWVIMKKHTVIGAEILKDADVEFIRFAADIALTHHEKWNGSGYPRGLKGTEIPLAGRIVAIADVFDALTSERPYKQPFPLEKALGIITEGRGTHFDPEVTDAFLGIEEEIKAEMKWWKFMLSPTASPDSVDLSDLFS